NRGVGRMLEAARLAGIHATGWTWSVLFGDLDNDGWQDLHVTNGIFRSFMDSDIVMQLARTREDSSRVWQRQSEAPERNVAFRNRGDLTFQDVSADWGLDELGIGFGAVLVDLDRDGDLDVVVNNYNAAPSIFRNNSQTGSALLVALRGRVSNRFGIGARVSVRAGGLTLVRELLSARGIVSGAVPELHFGLGAAAKVEELTVEWPSGRRQIFNDLPVNVELTLNEEGATVAPPAQVSPTRWREARETAGFPPVSLARNTTLVELKRQPLLPWRLNGLPGSLAWADVNGDGRPDCFVGGVGGSPGHLAVATGEPGHFRLQSGPWIEDTEAYDAVVLWHDVNGDGNQDLLLVSGGAEYEEGASNYRPRLFLNDGHGLFTRAPDGMMPDLRVSAGAAVYFEMEGRLHLFIGGRHVPGRYPDSPRSYLLELREGRFVDITDVAAPALRELGMVTGAVAMGERSELFVTQEWGAPRLFRHGPNGWSESSASELPANLEGLWQSAAAADLNGDGRPDFIVGNFGLNTRYHGSPQRPTLLLAGDLAGSGQHSLLDLTFDGDVIRPWRGMTELSRGLGSRSFAMRLLQKFPTFESYAQAPIEQIFSSAVLSKATLLPAGELRSGVLLSSPRGYTFAPLPTEAQLAPVMGITTGDLDGDGLTDVVITQGFSGPVPQSGRLQGGYGFVLKGDGHGGLGVLDPAKTGFVVPGDGRAVTIIDCDGDGQPDLAVVRNNSRPLLFLSNPIPPRR
ncbi:MAG: VCBS repeat-containing protein, partial [Opitutus sp.]